MSDWKEGARKRKEIQIGQRDARPVTGANKRKKPKKADKPWVVEVSYDSSGPLGREFTFTREFVSEEDATKYLRKEANWPSSWSHRTVRMYNKFEGE